MQTTTASGGLRFALYGCDQNVEAYTGEIGGNTNGSGNPSVVLGCEDGWSHPGDLQLANSFFVNGNYTGGGDIKRLYYDGHPGIDYQAASGTEVYAATAGVVAYPSH